MRGMGGGKIIVYWGTFSLFVVVVLVVVYIYNFKRKMKRIFQYFLCLTSSVLVLFYTLFHRIIGKLKILTRNCFISLCDVIQCFPHFRCFRNFIFITSPSSFFPTLCQCMAWGDICVYDSIVLCARRILENADSQDAILATIFHHLERVQYSISSSVLFLYVSRSICWEMSLILMQVPQQNIFP